jgi:hypothetical protein
MSNEQRNRSPPAESGVDLEAALGRNAGIDMDVKNFFALAGYWPSAPPETDANVQAAIRARYQDRRRQLSHSVKILETKFALTVRHGYGRDFRTLRELKAFIEEKGFVYPQMGYMSLAHFNETLQQYGLPAFRVGGYTRRDLLNRYGLEASSPK